MLIRIFSKIEFVFNESLQLSYKLFEQPFLRLKNKFG